MLRFQAPLRRHSQRGCAALAAAGAVLVAGCTPKADYGIPPQALWVANGSNVVEYTAAQLQGGGGAQAPYRTIDSAAFGSPQGLAFDGSGNLWVVDGGAASGGNGCALYEISAAQLAALAANQAPVPAISITTPGFVYPQQAAFDASGRLWVTDYIANAVYVFTPAQLAAGGAISPAITLTSPAFAGPLGIAFAPNGNLWIANNDGNSLNAFAAAGLPSTPGAVALTPKVVLSDDGQGAISAPWALAFDNQGNLWWSNAAAPETVAELTPAGFSASGSPAPALTVAPASLEGASTMAAPNGIAFDQQYDLAVVSSAAPYGLAVYGPAQLSAGGAADPLAFFVGAATTLNLPAGATYGPEAD